MNQKGKLTLIVEVSGLRKVYEGKQQVVAVDGISLGVQPGEIYGLLGPNGAGKTTTISICTTRVLPTAGVARIAGIDVVREPALARRSMGVIPQYNTLDRSCTVAENIVFHCLYFGFSRADARARTAQLLAQFHLTERAAAYPQQLSGGLAQRVQIARAIAHHPKVLFLDEPSAGLDPQSRIAMWDAVRGLRDEGITVVLTTPLHGGGRRTLRPRRHHRPRPHPRRRHPPAALKSSVGAQRMLNLKLRDHTGTAPLLDTLKRIPGVSSAESSGEGVRILAHNADGLLADIVAAANPFGLRDLTITETSLETVFIQLTGRDLRE